MYQNVTWIYLLMQKHHSRNLFYGCKDMINDIQHTIFNAVKKWKQPNVHKYVNKLWHAYSNLQSLKRTIYRYIAWDSPPKKLENCIFNMNPFMWNFRHTQHHPHRHPYHHHHRKRSNNKEYEPKWWQYLFAMKGISLYALYFSILLKSSVIGI